MRRASSAESLSTQNLFDWSKNRFLRVRKRLVELRSWATTGSVSDEELPSRTRPVSYIHDGLVSTNGNVEHGLQLNPVALAQAQSRAPKRYENVQNGGATHKQQVRKFFSRLADSGNAKAKTDTRETSESEHPYSYENNALELHDGDITDPCCETCNGANGACENCRFGYGNAHADTFSERPAGHGQQQADVSKACDVGEAAERHDTARKCSTPPVRSADTGATGEAAKVQKKARIKLPACALKMPPFEQEVNIACQTAIDADGTVRHMFASVPAVRPAVGLYCCAAHQLGFGLCTDFVRQRHPAAAAPMMTHRMRVAWANRRRLEKRSRPTRTSRVGNVPNGLRDGSQWTCYAVFGPESTPRNVEQPAFCHCVSPPVDVVNFQSRNTALVGGVRTQSLAAEAASLSLGPNALYEPTQLVSPLGYFSNSSDIWANTDSACVCSHAQLNSNFKAKLHLAASYRLPRPLTSSVLQCLTPNA